MNAAQHILILALRVYRGALSPVKAALLGPSARCRFTPSCSQYGLEAIQHHGAVSGSWLAVKRVCRCHPWGGCGHDPVPERAPKFGDASFRVRAVAVRRNDPNTPASARPAIKPAKLS